MSRTFEQKQLIIELSNRVNDLFQLILEHDKLVNKYIQPACGMVIFTSETIRNEVEQSESHPGMSEIEIAGNTLVGSGAARQILEDADAEQTLLEDMRVEKEDKATEEYLASKSSKVWVHLREFTVIGKIRQNMKSMLQLLKEADDEKTRELRSMPIFQS